MQKISGRKSQPAGKKGLQACRPRISAPGSLCVSPGTVSSHFLPPLGGSPIWGHPQSKGLQCLHLLHWGSSPLKKSYFCLFMYWVSQFETPQSCQFHFPPPTNKPKCVTVCLWILLKKELLRPTCQRRRWALELVILPLTTVLLFTSQWRNLIGITHDSGFDWPFLYIWLLTNPVTYCCVKNHPKCNS